MAGTHQAERANSAVSGLVVDWFRALDRHYPVDDLVARLAPDEFEMRLPAETRHGVAGFRAWYEWVTHRFFDEQHRVTSVRATALDGDQCGATEVSVCVNWQARVWVPPAAHSAWIGFDAEQTWRLVPGPDGRPLIRNYVVDALVPMPGSAAL